MMAEHWHSWRGAASYVYINILKLSHRKHNFKVILLFIYELCFDFGAFFSPL